MWRAFDQNLTKKFLIYLFLPSTANVPQGWQKLDRSQNSTKLFSICLFITWIFKKFHDVAVCLQIQPNWFPGYIFLKNSRRFFTWQAIRHQNAKVIPFIRRLPCVQCTKNRPTCKNCTSNYKIFQEHQPNSMRFPVYLGAISNSTRFTGFPGAGGMA